MATKRGNGEGSIYQMKDGRWRGAFLDLNGHRRVVTGKTRQDAASKLTKALSERNAGKSIPREQETVNGYLTNWLEMKRHNVRATTYRRYADYVNHLTPLIGKVRLARLGPEHVEGAYTALREKKLSETSIRHCHEMLSGALKAALGKEKVTRNAAALASNKAAPVRKEITPLSDAQAREFLRAVVGNRFESLYTIAITAGVRQGELLALRWSDVNLDEASIHIQRTLEHEGGVQFTFADTKKPKSRRHVKLTPQTVQSLRRHRALQAEERLALGPDWGEKNPDYRDLVFTDERGRPLDGRHRLDRDFAKVLTAAGLPSINFHSLRHTCATILLRKGVHPKIVSELLGHASVAITMDVYSHYIATMQAAAVDAMQLLQEA